MNETVDRRIVLAARPKGRPGPECFRIEEVPVPQPGAGEMLARTIYLSLAPYMRGRMNEGPSYARPVALGEVMTGGTVGEVVRSNLDGFAPGDLVVGRGGWQDYSVFRQGEAERVDPALAPITTALGVLGMPGQTAYVGLREIGRPKAGETLVVAATEAARGAEQAGERRSESGQGRRARRHALGAERARAERPPAGRLGPERHYPSSTSRASG